MLQLNNQTGISNDYVNAFVLLSINCMAYRRRLKNFESNLPAIRSTLKKYGERYPAETYEKVITPKNQKAVKRLDELVDALRNILEEDYLEIVAKIDSHLYPLLDEVTKLIYGAS